MTWILDDQRRVLTAIDCDSDLGFIDTFPQKATSILSKRRYINAFSLVNQARAMPFQAAPKEVSR